jgi:20S proteasome alpha/beta subunit
LTIIVGIKCSDGALIASDTQAEFGRGVSVKRLNANKIHCFDRFAVAGAGMVAHIEKAANAIERGLKAGIKEKGADLDEDEAIDILEKTITRVHKEYNIDRSRFLNDPDEREFFQPLLIFCGVSSLATGGPHSCLAIVHSAGLVEPIDDYATAGSGAAYAELVLKNYYRAGISVKEAIPIAIYTINEVKQIDPGCGGETRVAVVNEGKLRELSVEEIRDIAQGTHQPLDIVWKRIIPKVLKGEIDVGKLNQI